MFILFKRIFHELCIKILNTQLSKSFTCKCFYFRFEPKLISLYEQLCFDKEADIFFIDIIFHQDSRDSRDVQVGFSQHFFTSHSGLINCYIPFMSWQFQATAESKPILGFKY